MPLAQGIGATALVAFIVASWIAIGTYCMRDIADDDEVAAAVGVLAGSAITGFMLAVCALTGWVEEGVIAAGILSADALVRRRRRVWRILAANIVGLRRMGESTLLRMILAAFALLMWVAAIAPPRSADAMRYHLAHIRLIVEEGEWAPVADFHFALPFGWTLSYLPFELLGIPQGAQLLSVTLGFLMTAAIVRLLVKEGARPVGIGLALLMLLHPFVVRAFTEASADPYTLFAVAAAAILLVRAPHASVLQAGLFGFVAFVGMQSRYQAIAVGIAGCLAFAVAVRKREARGRLAFGVMVGAACAMILASPFYLANLTWFGNPVWPLLVPRPDAAAPYADVVAWHYGKSLTGNYTLSEIATAIGHLLTWPRLFPLALAIVAAVVAAAFPARRKMRTLSVFGIVFLLLWLLAQPKVYPRFILMILPVAAIIAGLGIGRDERAGANVRRLIEATAGAFLLATIAFSADPLRYAVTGDERSFHRTTWFFPVYEWMNAKTPQGSRTLAIVSSGMTYYLERPYRRGDPWIGGEIDWQVVPDAATLARHLRRRGYRYVVYEDRDWSAYEGGTEMQRVVADAIATGELIPIESFELRLHSSRARGTYRNTRVRVIEVPSGF